MKIGRVLACSASLVAGIAIGGAALAQQTLPDPATIDLPDLASDTPEAQAEGYKFFYFHNPDVSFAEAYSDLAECRSHLVAGSYLALPGFVPWDVAKAATPVETSNSYGLVGAAIGAIILPKLDRGLRNNKLRRCMGVRGYARYAAAEPAWNILNQGDEAMILARQAKLASGPAPTSREVTE